MLRGHRLVSGGILMLLLAKQAIGAGFLLLEQNASGSGSAYAGQAALGEDASTIFYNPAGMTQSPGKNFVQSVTVIRPSIKFNDRGSTTAPLQSSLGDNGGDAGSFAVLPNAFFSWQAAPQVFLGIGVNTPFGLKTEYDPTWVGRFHAIESDIKTLNINPSVAYRLSDRVSLGAGINYQYVKATLTNAVNYSAAAFAVAGAAGVTAVGGLGREGVAKVKGDDGAWGYNIGMTYQATPATRLGISYRSSMKYKVEGDVTFSNVPAALAGVPDVAAGHVSAHARFPAIAFLAVAHKLNSKWDVLADVSWTSWGDIKELNVVRPNGVVLSTTPLNWHDTWRIALGVNYHYNDAWTFRSGLTHDESPVPNADRTPRIPDQDRHSVSIGAQYRLQKNLAFDVGYGHLFVRDATSNLCSAAQAAGNAAACAGKNNLVGTYRIHSNLVSAQARYSF